MFGAFQIITNIVKEVNRNIKTERTRKARVRYLGHTLGAAPVAAGHVLEGRDQAEGVVAVVAAVTQQEALLLVATATHQAQVQVDLNRTHKHTHTHTKVWVKRNGNQNTNISSAS